MSERESLSVFPSGTLNGVIFPSLIHFTVNNFKTGDEPRLIDERARRQKDDVIDERSLPFRNDGSKSIFSVL